MATNDFDPAAKDDLDYPRYEDLQQQLNKQATQLIQDGANPDDVEKRLYERSNQIYDLYKQYGPKLFMPKQNDNYFKQSDYDLAKPGTNSDQNYGKPPVDASPDVPFSEGAAQGMPSDEEHERAKLRDLATSTYKNYTPGGLIAPIISGAGNIAQALGADYGRSFGDYLADQITPEENTPEGKKFNEVIGTPWSLLGQGQRKAGEFIQDNPGAASAYGMGTIYGPLAAIAGQTEEGRKLLATGVETAPTAAMLMGGAGKESPKDVPTPKPVDPIKTGDPDIDAGIKAASQPKQGDLFSPQNELGLDMFSKESVPADLIESRRQQAELANKGQLPPRSDAQNAALEQNYIFDQQDRLNANKPAEDVVSNQGEIPQPYLNIPHTEMPEGDTNSLMYRQMMQALADRGKLRNEPTPVNAEPSRQGEVFEPSRNQTIDQTQAQQQLPLKEAAPFEQPDLFSNAKKQEQAKQTEKPTSEEDETPEDRESRRQALLNQRKNKPLPGFGDDPSAYNMLPASILDAHDSNTLTAGHVLDAAADNHEDLFSHDPAQQGLADELRKNAEKLGGLDAKVEVIPEDPAKRTAEHNDAVARIDEQSKAEGKPLWDDENGPKGLYDPKTGKIFINGPKNMDLSTLLHESTHAVTHAAIQAGLDGKLTGDRLKAFNAMQNLFEATKNAGGVVPSKYGFTDLHEFAAELRSNPKFRDTLKNIPLDSISAGKMGFGRLLVGKITNAYQAAIAGLSKMIGLSPKATTAYDAAVSTSEGFFKSFDKAPDEARNSKPSLKEKEEGYKPFVTDPLSKWQQFKSGAIPTINRVILNRANGPFRDIRRASEEARNQTDEARAKGEEVASNLAKAQKAEGAPTEAVQDYMEKKKSTALDNYPQTKKVIDEQFDPLRQEHREKLADLMLSDPNISSKGLDFVEHILNNPGYLIRKYQNEGFTAGLMRNAQKADNILAQKPNAELPPALKSAKAIVDAARDWVRRTLLPEADMSGKTLKGLRSMAKGLGIDTAKLLDGVDSASKRAVLEAEIKRTVPDWETAQVAEERLLREVAGIVENKDQTVARYYRGARVGDIFTERDSIPPQLRKLWGEVEEPASVVAHTLIKQGTGIAHLRQQASIVEAGQKGGWLHDGKFTAPEGFNVKLRGTKYGPLKNLWTAPEIEKMLRNHIELSTAANNWTTAVWSGNAPRDIALYGVNKAVQGWGNLVTGFKMYTMALDLKYWQMYGFGGPSILLTHGIANPKYPFVGLVSHIAELSPAFRNALKGDFGDMIRDRVDRYRRNGFTEPTSSGEIYQSLQARKLAEALSAGGEKNWGAGLKQAMGLILSTPTRLGMHAMSLADGYAKRGAFDHRIDQLTAKYERRGIDKTQEQIESEAADHVKDTVITYDRAPVIARMSERLGASKGAIYVTETLRNAWNGLFHGKDDMMDGFKNNDPIMIGHGMKQIMGTLAAVTVMGNVINKVVNTGLSIWGMAANELSPTDQRQQYLQQKGSRFEGQRVEQISDPNTKNSFFFSPGDTNTYYYQIQQAYEVMADALQRHAAGEKIEPDEVGKNILGAFTGVMFRSSLVNGLLKTLQAKEPGWMQDTPILADKEKEYFKNTFHLSEDNVNRTMQLMDMLRPGVVRSFDKAAESGGSEGIKNLIRGGANVAQIPTDAGLSDRTGGIIVNQLNAAKKDLSQTIKSTANFDQDAIADSYKNAFKDSYKVLKTLQQDYQYAQANGLPKGKIIESMVTGGIPDAAIVAVMNGKLNPASMLMNDLTSTITKEYERNQDDPDKQKQLVHMYADRVKQLSHLTGQYMKLTPEQIEGL